MVSSIDLLKWEGSKSSVDYLLSCYGIRVLKFDWDIDSDFFVFNRYFNVGIDPLSYLEQQEEFMIKFDCGLASKL